MGKIFSMIAQSFIIIIFFSCVWFSLVFIFSETSRAKESVSFQVCATKSVLSVETLSDVEESSVIF